jgi:MFS family permease
MARETENGVFCSVGLDQPAKACAAAAFLGWSLDAFDYFLLVFELKDIATEFNTDISNVTIAILLTLAMRPLGAFLFGRAADRWGRRPTLMANVALYSVLEFASGFAPNLTALIVLRALYGIAMGGEWGVGASLTMETFLRMRGASFRVFCSPAILRAISWLRSSMAFCFNISAGAECS